MQQFAYGLLEQQQESWRFTKLVRFSKPQFQ